MGQAHRPHRPDRGAVHARARLRSARLPGSQLGEDRPAARGEDPCGRGRHGQLLPEPGGVRPAGLPRRDHRAASTGHVPFRAAREGTRVATRHAGSAGARDGRPHHRTRASRRRPGAADLEVLIPGTKVILYGMPRCPPSPIVTPRWYTRRSALLSTGSTSSWFPLMVTPSLVTYVTRPLFR